MTMTRLAIAVVLDASTCRCGPRRRSSLIRRNRQAGPAKRWCAVRTILLSIGMILLSPRSRACETELVGHSRRLPCNKFVRIRVGRLRGPDATVLDKARPAMYSASKKRSADAVRRQQYVSAPSCCRPPFPAGHTRVARCQHGGSSFDSLHRSFLHRHAQALHAVESFAARSSPPIC